MTELFPAYHLLQHQAVRDLAWSCLSEPLLDSLPGSDASVWRNTNPERDWEWLLALDRQPQPLLDHLAQMRSTRLGIYFENLWKFYLQAHSDTRLLAHNLQLRKADGTTRGAFDFLLLQANTGVHLETAVKLYLGQPDATADDDDGWQHWLGPNCNDRLDLKLNRLRNHQLPLSQCLEAQTLLAEVAGARIGWQRALCLQGYFFYPALADMPPPDTSNGAHAGGTWFRLSDFVRRTDRNIYWIILPRQRWLSPGLTRDLHELLSGKSLCDTLTHWVGVAQRPVLLAAVQRENGCWIETQRHFIVPDQWPWTESPARST